MKDIPFDALIAIGSLVYALGLFTDNLIGKQWSSVIKQGKTWVIGVIAVVWAAHLSWTGNWTVGGVHLQSLSGWSQVFLGLTGSAFANTGFHIAQRFDPTGSGDTPDMPVPNPPKLVRNHRTDTRKKVAA